MSLRRPPSPSREEPPSKLPITSVFPRGFVSASSLVPSFEWTSLADIYSRHSAEVWKKNDTVHVIGFVTGILRAGGKTPAFRISLLDVSMLSPQGDSHPQSSSSSSSRLSSDARLKSRSIEFFLFLNAGSERDSYIPPPLIRIGDIVRIVNGQIDIYQSEIQLKSYYRKTTIAFISMEDALEMPSLTPAERSHRSMFYGCEDRSIGDVDAQLLRETANASRNYLSRHSNCASDYMVSIGTEFPGDRSDCICRVISPFRTSSQNTLQGLISVCDGSVYSDPQNRIFPPVYSSSEQTDSESSSQKDSNSIPFSYAGTEAIVKTSDPILFSMCKSLVPGMDIRITGIMRDKNFEEKKIYFSLDGRSSVSVIPSWHVESQRLDGEIQSRLELILSHSSKESSLRGHISAGSSSSLRRIHLSNVNQNLPFDIATHSFSSNSSTSSFMTLRQIRNHACTPSKFRALARIVEYFPPDVKYFSHPLCNECGSPILSSLPQYYGDGEDEGSKLESSSSSGCEHSVACDLSDGSLVVSTDLRIDPLDLSSQTEGENTTASEVLCSVCGTMTNLSNSNFLFLLQLHIADSMDDFWAYLWGDEAEDFFGMEPRNLRDDPIQAEEIESKLKTAIESQACIDLNLISYFTTEIESLSQLSEKSSDRLLHRSASDKRFAVFGTRLCIPGSS